MTCKYCDVFLGTDGDGVASHYPEGVCPDCSTVRDKFAAAALTGMCADLSGRVVSSGNLNINLLAVEAFKYAEAMMEARKKK